MEDAERERGKRRMAGKVEERLREREGGVLLTVSDGLISSSLRPRGYIEKLLCSSQCNEGKREGIPNTLSH